MTYIFLQDWRATIIPAPAIPFSLIGTFGVLLMMGYSANIISFFVLILAIVVVENVQRLVAEEVLDSRKATKKAITQISVAVIVTISVAVVILSFNALTFSPALCSPLMRSENLATRGPLGWFNKAFDTTRIGYVATVRKMARMAAVSRVILGGVHASSFLLFTNPPTGFLPEEDRGAFFIDIQLPDAASFSRTEEMVNQSEEFISGVPGFESIITVPGCGLLGGSSASNAGHAVVVLDLWDKRDDPSLAQDTIMAQIQGQLSALAAANAFAFSPPPIPGLGATGGFDFKLQDVRGRTPQQLLQALGALAINANQDPDLQAVFNTYRSNVPQLFMNIDRDKIEALCIPLVDIFTTLQANLGSCYVNNFNYLGRIFQVIVQAEEGFHTTPDDIRALNVRTRGGEMVLLSSLVAVETILGPETLNRYNNLLFGYGER
ncbi:MAG: efflux RND transporter permease subunit [Rhodospirillales bacterium]|nr:efflux RND transporter permease subunit [Rhodospirillales bacterium]